MKITDSRSPDKYMTACHLCGRAATYGTVDKPLCTLHEHQRLRIPPKLSPKQIIVVQEKVKAEFSDLPQSVAARKAFPNQTPHAAEVSMSSELRKPDVRLALEIALERRGLTVDKIIGVVDDAMIATKPNPTPPPDKDDTEDTAYEATIPDHSVRLKAASMAARFLGMDKPDTENGIRNYNFINLSETQRAQYRL